MMVNLETNPCGTRIDVGFSIAGKTAIKSQGSWVIVGLRWRAGSSPTQRSYWETSFRIK